MKALCILLVFSLSACQPSTPEPPPAPPTQEPTPPEVAPSSEAEPFAEREPTDEEIREYGLIQSIEDGPYPMFVMSVEFPERQMRIDFDLNIESVDMDRSLLDKLPGSYATIFYLSEVTSMLEDVLVEGESVFGEYAPEYDSSWSTMSGTLQGAKTPSGDLPGQVVVVSEDGREIHLTTFIDDDLIAANGKQVEAFYADRYSNRITYLRPSTD